MKTFKTKTGFCHVLPDKIVLTKDGLVNDLDGLARKSNTERAINLITSVGLVIGMFFLGFSAYTIGQNIHSVICGLMGIFLIYGIIKSLKISEVSVIERQRITRIKLKKAIKGLTRSRFEVMYKDENGNIKKRLILLPDSLFHGQNETDIAVKIMTNEQLLD